MSKNTPKTDVAEQSSEAFQVGCESSFSAIGYTVKATVNRETVIKLAGIGLDKLVGAKPSSTADQLLGYNPDLKANVKRPDKWKRKLIPFSEANAAALKNLYVEYLSKQHDVLAEVDTFKSNTQDAFKDARIVLANMVQAFKDMPDMLATWAQNHCGYTGEDLSEDNIEFLAAIAEANAKLSVKK